MRLVLCDRNRILCEALAATLQNRGHQVLAVAASATGCIAAVATHRPDARLLDPRFRQPNGRTKVNVATRLACCGKGTEAW
jgi:DNA-binding NarL/FixJ family response regulator